VNMNYSVIDTEVSGATNGTIGNSFSSGNKLVSVGCLNGVYLDWIVDRQGNPYGMALPEIHSVTSGLILVGFNLKFDLHWLRRYGAVGLPFGDLWDCQAAHFIITGQKNPYPSLNDVSEHYGLGQKLDIVKTEYWDKGIDTDQVPVDVLLEYQKQDVLLTEQIFLKQIEYLKDKPQLKRLIWYTCQDLAVTAEMEWNGIKYDLKKSMGIGDGLADEIRRIDKMLRDVVPDVFVNWNSNDHLSAVLYGGRVPVDRKEEYLFHYKDIRKPSVTKTRTVRDLIEFPRLIEPLKGTELKKEGYWSAVDDQYEITKDGYSISKTGYGRTELEALKNICNQEGDFDGN